MTSKYREERLDNIRPISIGGSPSLAGSSTPWKRLRLRAGSGGGWSFCRRSRRHDGLLGKTQADMAKRKMSELKSIELVSQPGTRASIAADLDHLGVARGMVLIVHSSLSAMGWVNGGPLTVIHALMDLQ